MEIPVPVLTPPCLGRCDSPAMLLNLRGESTWFSVVSPYEITRFNYPIPFQSLTSCDAGSGVNAVGVAYTFTIALVTNRL